MSQITIVFIIYVFRTTGQLKINILMVPIDAGTMSKPQKPVRQDYIAKVRYINNLPPPPLHPKFLKYNVSEQTTPHEENENLMSSLFRKENFLLFIGQVDEEYGMPINPLQSRGFLDGSNEKAIFANNAVPLHPKDKVLMRDAGIGNINKSEPGVSFLRRTEYIAERLATSRSEDRAASAARKEEQEQIDPEAQLQAVEQSFDRAQVSLNEITKLRHPRKKQLRAVAAWPLLPDTSMMDTKFLSVKFTGSASLNRELQTLKRKEGSSYDEEFQRKSLLTAIYKPITSEDGEWVSFYHMKDKKGVEDLAEKLTSTEKEQPVNLLDDEDQDLEVFRFKHFKNFDMQYQRFSKPLEELALKFVSEEPGSKKRKAAYYYPISGRVELKKHRASTNTEINRFLNESTTDVLNFKVREPNTNELKRMDNIRSEYDPMEYEGEDEEDDEEDAEFAGNDNGEEDIAAEFDRATEAESS